MFGSTNSLRCMSKHGVVMESSPVSSLVFVASLALKIGSKSSVPRKAELNRSGIGMLAPFFPGKNFLRLLWMYCIASVSIPLTNSRTSFDSSGMETASLAVGFAWPPHLCACIFHGTRRAGNTTWEDGRMEAFKPVPPYMGSMEPNSRVAGEKSLRTMALLAIVCDCVDPNW